jgi:hypothetical protein
MTLFLPVMMPMWAQMSQLPGGPAEGPPPLPFPEIVPPPEVAVSLPLLWLAIGVLILLLALWFLIKPFLGRAVLSVLPTRRPLQAALRALRELRGRATVESPMAVGHAVSDILRVYYLDRYGVPAPFRTTEELFPTVHDVYESSRRRHWREKFEPLALRYDALAYAPPHAGAQAALALVDEAIARLESEVGTGEPEPEVIATGRTAK